MSNMSYCRFENTYKDLQDCFNNFDDDEDLSKREASFRIRLFQLCQDIVKTYDLEDLERAVDTAKGIDT